VRQKSKLIVRIGPFLFDPTSLVTQCQNTMTVRPSI